MPVELRKFEVKDLKKSEKYLLVTLASEVIKDVSNPYGEDYMKFANLLVGNLLFSGAGDKAALLIWKRIYKAIRKSEERFNYKIYKGHLLTEIALYSLVTECDLDKVVNILKESYEEDRLHGYTNPEYRPAYKILSFMQPIFAFRNELWPPDKKLRREIANRLSVVLRLNRSSTGIAWGPGALQKNVSDCIPDNEPLLKILTDNVTELEEIALLAEQKNTFYKSMTFLIANIAEGVLLDLAKRSSRQGPPQRNLIRLFSWIRKKPKTFNFERDSIKQLSRKLRQKNIIDDRTEYLCRFIQHYRDFIHPARNLKHDYILNVNFNKMFLFFFILLLGDLAKASEKLSPVWIR